MRLRPAAVAVLWLALLVRSARCCLFANRKGFRKMEAIGGASDVSGVSSSTTGAIRAWKLDNANCVLSDGTQACAFSTCYAVDIFGTAATLYFSVAGSNLTVGLKASDSGWAGWALATSPGMYRSEAVSVVPCPSCASGASVVTASFHGYGVSQWMPLGIPLGSARAWRLASTKELALVLETAWPAGKETVQFRYAAGHYKSPPSGTIHDMGMHPGIPPLAQLDRRGAMQPLPGYLHMEEVASRQQ